MKVLPLDKNERLKFVNAILAARKKNPNLGWSALFNLGRKALAPGRMSEKIDHPNKIAWIKPMLGMKDVPKDKITRNGKLRTNLTDEDRTNFAQAIFELRKKNPHTGPKILIQEANKILDGDKQFSPHVDSFSQIPWIKPMLAELENQSGKKIQYSSGKANFILSKEEQLAFAKAFFEFKKSNPEAGSVHAIRHANSLLSDDRKIGSKIDSVKQIKWIIPLLEELENPPKAVSRFECKLTDKEKEQFADIVYKLRKGGASWTRCMKEANTFMPEGHKIAASVSNPSGVPWLQRALAKLEEADKSKVAIDQRGVLPRAEEFKLDFKKERKHSETKTYWNDEEKEYFAEITYQLKLCNPGWGWQKILDEANMEMPGHKRRPKMPPSPSQMPWLNPLLDKIAKRPAPQRELEPVKLPEIAPPPPAPEQNPLAILIQQEIQRQVAAALAGQGTLPVNGLAPVNNVQQEKPARKKVIVVGLLPVQTNDIQKRFGHKFDFKFIGSNTPNQQIRESIKHGDIGILMTRFVSHPTQAAMRDHPGFTFCNGNSTALENLLEEKALKLDGQ